ncbi:hypothetical protein Bca101_045992 [Brassica carinata]
MVRGRVEVKRIESKVNRQVTFSKRKGGLLKKAYELSVLCDVEVALIIFSSSGKLYEFSSDAMEKTIERYNRCNNNILDNNRPEESTQRWSQEVTKLRSKYESLLRTHRYLLGENLGEMSVKELETLERQLEGALSATRQRKLVAEGHEFKGFQDLLLNSDAWAGSTDFSLLSSHHNSVDCDVGQFLKIGFQQQCEQGEGSLVLKSNVEHRKMKTLYLTRGELTLIILYLNKAEARDKICRAIQFGSKFLSGGKPGTAQTVDKNTSLARKVFRLFKFLNDFQCLISPAPKGTPLPLVLLGKSRHALLFTYFFVDQFVWLGRSGIYKNKILTELIGGFANFCWLGSSICNVAIEIIELIMLSSYMKKKKIEKELKDDEKKNHDELHHAKLQKSKERILALVKSSMDIVTVIGLLRLAPFIVTTRVTGGFGFITSLISCYQLLPVRHKLKTP